MGGKENPTFEYTQLCLTCNFRQDHCELESVARSMALQKIDKVSAEYIVNGNEVLNECPNRSEIFENTNWGKKR